MDRAFEVVHKLIYNEIIAFSKSLIDKLGLSNKYPEGTWGLKSRACFGQMTCNVHRKLAIVIYILFFSPEQIGDEKI